MVTIRTSQVIHEIHYYELTDEKYKEYKKIKETNKKLMFLDDIGGSPAEYESLMKFRFGVAK